MILNCVIASLSSFYMTIGVRMICIQVNNNHIVRKLELENSLGALIFLASKSQERIAEIAIKKQLGLTPSQWKIILALNMMNGLTQKDLAEKIYIDGSTLVPVIDKMEKNGWVERKLDSKDRRINRVFLTKKSESTVNSITLIIMQLRKIIYKGISESEIDRVKKTLKNIIENSDKAFNEVKSVPDKT